MTTLISFQPTDEENAFVKIAKDIAIEKIRPAARSCEENRSVDKALVNEIKELGLLALELPEDFEGMELPLISQVQIAQALSYGDLGIVQGLPGAGDAASLIRLIKEHKVLHSFKVQLAANENPTVAYLDITATEDTVENSISVTNKGDSYTIHGISQPVRLAKSADYLAIAATDSENNRLILWLDNEAGHKWSVEKGDYRLGLLAAGIGRISFEHVNITGENIIATEDEASKLLEKLQTRLHILHAAKQVGLMQAALNYATEYTATRKAFGKEIAKFQGVSFRVAAMAIETRSASHFVWEAAVHADRDEIKSKKLALRALSRAHRSVSYVTDSAVQLLGGHGYVQDFPVEKWMRDAQAQVTLYGRERELLIRFGEEILRTAKGDNK